MFHFSDKVQGFMSHSNDSNSKTSTNTFTAPRKFTVTQPKLLGHLSYVQLQLSGKIHTIIVGHHEQYMGDIMCKQTSLFIIALTC
jgi:hypothetical protein